MLLYVLSVFSVIFALCSAGESELPLTICKRDSDDYSACLKRAAEETWLRFAAGLPEFDIPPLDPLFQKYEKIVMDSDYIRGELILSNFTIIGLSKLRALNVKTYFLDDVFRLEIDVNISKIFSKGAMKVNGNLNAFRIANEGHYNLIMEDMSGIANFTGHVINDTWIVEHFHFVPSIGKFKFYYDDVVKEKKAFTDIVVNFVNKYWAKFYQTAVSLMSDRMEMFFTDFANKFFSKVPFSKVFP